MTVNVQQYEYVREAGDTAGLVVVILPQYQMPFPEDEGIMVSPGHATSIAIVQVGNYCCSACPMWALQRNKRHHISQIPYTYLHLTSDITAL